MLPDDDTPEIRTSFTQDDSTTPQVDQNTLAERADLTQARQLYLQNLKLRRNIALTVFASITVLLLICWYRLTSTSSLTIIMGGLQLISLLYLAYLSVVAVAYLYREYRTLDAIITLSLAVFFSTFGLAFTYLVFGISNDNQFITLNYLHTLYFSFVTITTLGYGDFHPIGLSMLFAAAEAIIGYVLLGTFVGYIVAQMSRTDSRVTNSELPTDAASSLDEHRRPDEAQPGYTLNFSKPRDHDELD